MFKFRGRIVVITEETYIQLLQEGCPIIVGGNIITNKTNYPYFIENKDMNLIVSSRTNPNPNNHVNKNLIFHNETDIIDDYYYISNLIGHDFNADYQFKINNDMQKYLGYYDQKYLDLLIANRIEFVCDSKEYARKLMIDNVLLPSLYHFLVVSEHVLNYDIKDIKCEEMIIINCTNNNININIIDCNIKKLIIINGRSENSYAVIDDVKRLTLCAPNNDIENSVKIIGLGNESIKYKIDMISAGHMELNKMDVLIGSSSPLSVRINCSDVNVMLGVIFSELIVDGSYSSRIIFRNIVFESLDSLFVIDVKMFSGTFCSPSEMPTNNFRIKIHFNVFENENESEMFRRLLLDDRYDFKFSKLLNDAKYGLTLHEICRYNYGASYLEDKVIIGAEYLEDKLNIMNDNALNLTVNKELNNVCIENCIIKNLDVLFCGNVKIVNCSIEGSVKIKCRNLSLVENVRKDRSISVKINGEELNALTIINESKLDCHMLEYDIMSELICSSNLDYLYLINAMIFGTINVDHIRSVKLYNCNIMHLINRLNDTIKLKKCLIHKITKNH